LNLSDIADRKGEGKYSFVRGDICDYKHLKKILGRYNITVIVHFAAESHVDRSIVGPRDFIETNISGTFNLLDAARSVWGIRKDVRFHHVSTDEVYGSLGEQGRFHETSPYDPRSPYSASKAGSDHLVRAYWHTYGLPVSISNCSNNYGPYHFPEKLIPLMILSAIEGKRLPVYGDGRNVRDWLYVEDHCEAIWLILSKGKTGGTYNIGGDCEKQNVEVVVAICDILEEVYPSKDNPRFKDLPSCIYCYRDLITFVNDRPGHDRRYAINCDKIRKELGWKQRYDFEGGLKHTIEWYLQNLAWVNSVRNGEYKKWIEQNYAMRS